MFRHTSKTIASAHKLFSYVKSRLCTGLVHDNFSVIYENNGKPTEVLKGQHTQIDSASLTNNELFVKMLMSPVNPSDINLIEGLYPIKFALPTTAGKEGVAQVLSTGNDVTHFAVGDLVIADNTIWGAWTNYVKAPKEDFIKIPADVPLVIAATLMVNTCTAYRMLMDFEELKPGDVVIQNGANSGAGQSVIQIAAAKGLQTVNIIRDRENLDEMVEYLKGIGASHVVTEEFVRTSEMKELMSSLPKARLALNCVGGRSATQLIKLLRGSGTMVTYGGMSMSPVSVPTSVFIFQQIKLVGFWMSRWHQEHKNTEERQAMFDDLFSLAIEGKLLPPRHAFSPLSDFQETVRKAMESSASKQMFKITE